jgi:hypothetical protein
MYPTDGKELSNPSPTQVSWEEPEGLKSERRLILTILLRGFILIIGVAGINRLFTAQTVSESIIGAGCVIVGLAQLALIIRNRVRRIIGLRRMHLGLCPICKYNMAFSTGRCPECGNDPFDW